MKTVITIIITCALALIALFGGYQLGIRKATTSEGWVENESFLLEVDGHIYEWLLDEE